MRLDTHSDVRTGGHVEHEQAYSIDFSPFMASLLSDKLYSDKPTAVWRELYSNAHDEMDDNRDPIRIKLPTRDDPTCMIWDNGKGLSKDGLIDLFTTYGASDKRGTNGKIGGFGVGSKVIFAYCDSFTATSVQEGTYEKTTIMCYKDATGMPTVRIVAHSIADRSERFGLKLDWSVAASDVVNFRSAFIRVTSRFKYQPTIGDERFKPLFKKYDAVSKDGGLSWGMKSEEFKALTSEGPTVVMGGVPYQLDVNMLASGHVSNDYLQPMLTSHVDIFVPVGSVQVAASREGLSYDPVTIAYLNRRVKEYYAEVCEVYQTNLSACATQWDAFQWYRATFPHSSYQYRSKESLQRMVTNTITWKGMACSDLYTQTTVEPYGYSYVVQKNNPYRVKPEDHIPWTQTVVTRNLAARDQTDISLREWSRQIDEPDNLILYFVKVDKPLKSVNASVTNYLNAMPKHPNRLILVNANPEVFTAVNIPAYGTTPHVVWDKAMNDKWVPEAKARVKRVGATSVTSPDTLRTLNIQANYITEADICFSNTTHMHTFDQWDDALKDQDVKWYVVKDTAGGLAPITDYVKRDSTLMQKLFFLSYVQGKTFYCLPSSQKSRLKGRETKWKMINDSMPEFLTWINNTYDPSGWLKTHIYESVNDKLPPLSLMQAAESERISDKLTTSITNPASLALWKFYKDRQVAISEVSKYRAWSETLATCVFAGINRSTVDYTVSVMYNKMNDILQRRKLLPRFHSDALDVNNLPAFIAYLNDETVNF